MYNVLSNNAVPMYKLFIEFEFIEKDEFIGAKTSRGKSITYTFVQTEQR